MGVTAIGQTAVGNLQPLAAGETSSPYHTWRFQVPAGAAALTVVLDSPGVLDLAMKHGSEIMSYSDLTDGGDWHYWEWAPEGGGQVVIQVPTPQAGTWFVDVINFGNESPDGRYTLRVDVR